MTFPLAVTLPEAPRAYRVSVMGWHSPGIPRRPPACAYAVALSRAYYGTVKVWQSAPDGVQGKPTWKLVALYRAGVCTAVYELP